MKFVTALIAVAAAQDGFDCTDDNIVLCRASACCGFLVDPDQPEIGRKCSNDAQDAPQGMELTATQTFSCEDPNAAADGAEKLVLGATALAASFYLMLLN